MPACRGEQALTDAEHALSLRPDWAKPGGRKAAALLQLGRVGAAAEAYQRGLQLEPGNAALREGLVQAQKAQRQQQRAAAAGSKQSASAVQAQSLKPALGAQLERSESYPASGHSRGNGSTRSSKSSGYSAVGSAAAGAPLMAAWRQLRQQADDAAIAVAALQRQMHRFEQQLLLNDAEQNQQPEEQPASLAHLDGREDTGQMPAAAGAGSGEEQADAQASCDTPDLAITSAHPDPTAAAPEPSESSGEGGSGSSPAGSSEDEGIEEVYPEVPSAATPSGPRAKQQQAGQQQGATSAVPNPTAASSSHSCSSGEGSSSASGEGISDGTAEGGRDTSSDGSTDSDSDSGSSSDSDSGSDSAATAWLASVQAARRQLAEAGGGLAPLASTGRRQPRSAQQASAAGGASGLGLGSLRQMCAAAEAAALAKDAGGVARAACKRCGSGTCPRFRPAGTVGDAAAVAAMLEQQSGAGSSVADLSVLQTGGSSLCASCGCASSVHETTKEAAAREARQRRQQQRLEREQHQQRACSQSGPSAAASTATVAATAGMQPEPAEDRKRRVAAAAERRAAAAAAGEQLQESDCDVLGQQKRGGCGGCTGCPGFRILFR